MLVILMIGHKNDGNVIKTHNTKPMVIYGLGKDENVTCLKYMSRTKFKKLRPQYL